LTVKVVTPGSVVDVQLRDGATIADAAAEARVDDTFECRYLGSQVSPADRGRHVIRDGDTLVFTAPQLKHGR
jgi:hypothetical protein